MIERLRTLARMQKFDDEIGRCRELQQVLPKQLNDLIKSVEDAEAHLNEHKAVQAGINKKQQDLEGEIKRNNDLIHKYEGQQAEIKTNKEYKALNGEITSLRQKNSDIESQLLELMDTEAEVKKQMKVYQDAFNQAMQCKQDKEADLRAQIAALENQIEQLRKERNAIAVTLPESLIKQYGNLIRNKNNKAVAYALNGACGGCGFIIRPQIRIELELKKKIINCESCGRILMQRIDEETDATE